MVETTKKPRKTAVEREREAERKAVKAELKYEEDAVLDYLDMPGGVATIEMIAGSTQLSPRQAQNVVNRLLAKRKIETAEGGYVPKGTAKKAAGVTKSRAELRTLAIQQARGALEFWIRRAQGRLSGAMIRPEHHMKLKQLLAPLVTAGLTMTPATAREKAVQLDTWATVIKPDSPLLASDLKDAAATLAGIGTEGP